MLNPAAAARVRLPVVSVSPKGILSNMKHSHHVPKRCGSRSRPTGTVQLRLLPGGTPTPDWVLDERTRTVGRQGVAHAREILRRVAPPEAVRRAS